MEVLAFISFFLGASWDFFTEINVPGFEFSFAALFVGLFLATLGLRFLFAMIGISAPTDDVVHMLTENKNRKAAAWEKRMSGRKVKGDNPYR